MGVDSLFRPTGTGTVCVYTLPVCVCTTRTTTGTGTVCVCTLPAVCTHSVCVYTQCVYKCVYSMCVYKCVYTQHSCTHTAVHRVQHACIITCPRSRAAMDCESRRSCDADGRHACTLSDPTLSRTHSQGKVAGRSRILFDTIMHRV